MLVLETLQHAHGNYTKATIARAGKMVGSLGKALDDAFQENVAETSVQESFRKKCDYSEDVSIFVERFLECGLFDNVVGRKHHTYQNFNGKANFNKPEELKKRLILYSKKLDETKRTLNFSKTSRVQ